MTLALVTCTIPAGQSLSNGVALTAGRLVRIRTPSAWDSANITFQVASADVPGEYHDVYNRFGEEIVIASVEPDTVIALPAEVTAFLQDAWLKIRSGHAGLSVPQNAACNFEIVLLQGAATGSTSAGKPHGQCIYRFENPNGVLRPWNGNALIINGTVETVPSAGVTLAPTGLPINTLYYIYAWMNGAAMTLEASATGHTQDTATGVEIKTGDSTRTLVGMAYVLPGPIFADTESQRLVRTWFNDRGIAASGKAVAILTTTSTIYVTIDNNCFAQTLVWPRERLEVIGIGAMGNNTISSATFAKIYIGGALSDNTAVMNAPASGLNVPFTVRHQAFASAEGSLLATLQGKVSAGVGNWYATGPTDAMMIFFTTGGRP